VLEGLPGAEGPVVVRQGDRMFGVTVDRVERFKVVVSAGGAVWELTIDPTQVGTQ
jgi:hypothetical protein